MAKMKRDRSQRKPGRLMGHSDEAVTATGEIDNGVLKDLVLKDMIAAFNAKEYLPLAFSEGELSNGDTIIVCLRQKGGTSVLPALSMDVVQKLAIDVIGRIDSHQLRPKAHTVTDLGNGLESYIMVARKGH